MTFQQLQYFLKIYETGSLSAAAQELFLTRSALSKAMKDLEEEYGCRLFTRTPEGLVATEVGTELRRNALKITALFHDTERLLHTAAGAAQDTLTVGITPATAVTIFPEIHRAFLREHPGVSLIPFEGGGVAVQDALETGKLQFCFTTYSEVFPDRKGRLRIAPNMDSAKLFDTELVLCVPADHPLAGRKQVTAQELLEEKFVFLKKPLQREAEISHRFLAFGHSPNVVYRTTQISTVRQLVCCGLGVSLQPRGTIDDGRQVVGIPLDPPAPCTNALIWNQAALATPAARDFLDFCLNYDWC